jgi:hypothetical protein
MFVVLIIGLVVGFLVGGRAKVARLGTEELVSLLAARQKAADVAREAAAKVSEVIAKVSEVIGSSDPKAPQGPAST